MMNNRNQQLKKARIVRIFVNSVNELALFKQVTEITLRDVADQAGYNSATLYNYFKNMDQLIHFAIFDAVVKIWVEASKLNINSEHTLAQYYHHWEAQCKIAFEIPNLFIYFFLVKDKSVVYDCAKQYFEIFPETYPLLSERFISLIDETQFEVKNLSYLDPCVQAGFFLKQDIKIIIEKADILFGGILLQIVKYADDHTSKEKYTQHFFECLNMLLQPYLLKKH